MNKCNLLQFPLFSKWTDFTPTVPKLYWDVYSQEERIKKICIQLHRIMQWLDKSTEILNDNVELIQNFINQIEVWVDSVNNQIDLINETIEQLKESIDNDVTDLIAKIEAEEARAIAAEENISNSLSNITNYVYQHSVNALEYSGSGAKGDVVLTLVNGDTFSATIPGATNSSAGLMTDQQVSLLESLVGGGKLRALCTDLNDIPTTNTDAYWYGGICNSNDYFLLINPNSGEFDQRGIITVDANGDVSYMLIPQPALAINDATDTIKGIVKYDNVTIKKNANDQLYADIPAVSSFETGMVQAFATSILPSGWHKLDGSIVEQTSGNWTNAEWNTIKLVLNNWVNNNGDIQLPNLDNGYLEHNNVATFGLTGANAKSNSEFLSNHTHTTAPHSHTENGFYSVKTAGYGLTNSPAPVQYSNNQILVKDTTGDQYTPNVSNTTVAINSTGITQDVDLRTKRLNVNYAVYIKPSSYNPQTIEVNLGNDFSSWGDCMDFLYSLCYANGADTRDSGLKVTMDYMTEFNGDDFNTGDPTTQDFPTYATQGNNWVIYAAEVAPGSRSIWLYDTNDTSGFNELNLRWDYNGYGDYSPGGWVIKDMLNWRQKGIWKITI